MGKNWVDLFVLIMMYLGVFTILVWAFLKAFGIINTPIYIEMLPYVGGGVTLFGMVYYFGKMMNRFESMDSRLRFLSTGFFRMRDDFIDVRKN
ncbi:MAG: hypothetical protein KJ592_02585 [Nanoarchaeota archaeon]|nr:hypothetical protein [Nanoarchaeota archaeon]